jgi:hypothetical protein
MKKNITQFILTCLLILSGLGLFAQGMEDFTNYPETANAYHDGTFAGLDGSTWTYKQCRGDSAINAPTPTLGKDRTPAAEITSGLLANGIGTLSFDYKQVFSTNVGLNVMVNGVLLTTVTSTGEQGITKNSGSITVNVSGAVTLSFIQPAGAGQVAIDNVTWTAFGGGTPDPEPTNYPVGFAATGAGLGVNVSWTDATGAQLPAAYLVKISETDNISAPVDNTFIGDDLNLSDGNGTKNVLQGVQQYDFSGLKAATTYYLKIFPYTNAGSIVNYKTDGTVPSGTGRTQAIVHEQTFNDGLAPWTQFSVLGEQLWVLDSIHGVEGSICMKVTGFVSATSTIANEDWLISPSISVSSGSSPKLEFFSAMNYGDNTTTLSALISTDYVSGDPTTSGTWVELPGTPTFSPGGWAWTSSGISDIAAFSGSNVHVAFKYTCEATNARTWEIDNVRITNNSGVGITENLHLSKLTLYPNPSDGLVRFTMTKKGIYKLIVYSLVGEQVFTDQINGVSGQFDLSTLPSGIYIVNTIDTFSNDKTCSRLIIK